MAQGKDQFEGLEDLGPEGTSEERIRRMKRLMRQLYKEEFEAQRMQLPPIKARVLIVVVSFIAVLVFGVTTLYNFNRFVTLEERVRSSRGHVEDVIQRRANLFENLINLTLNQAALEQEVFRHVADKRPEMARSGKEGGAGLAGGAGVAGLPSLSKLLAVVERYPQIRSSVTYQQLMDKLVEIEDRISKRRDEYNEEVRIFNTLISSFPWYVMARVTGFTRYDYFRYDKDSKETAFLRSRMAQKAFKRLLPLGGGRKAPTSGETVAPMAPEAMTPPSDNGAP
ncbi:MAG: LemA family protein [Magnetococcales bacterium]|nr:LemA family protein [Magnetococcales bacterium]